MTILYLPKFAREFKKLDQKIKELAVKKEKLFRKNPFDPRLKTHRLHGELEGFLAFSIDRKHRIIFDFQDKDTVRLYRVGSHSIYDF